MLQIYRNDQPTSHHRRKSAPYMWNKPKIFLQNIFFKFVIPIQVTLYSNIKTSPPNGIRTKLNSNRTKYTEKRIVPDITYSRPWSGKPTRAFSNTRLKISSMDLPKNKTSTQFFQQRFKEVIEKKYKGGNHAYTIGSISETGVGVRATAGKHTKSASLQKSAPYLLQKLIIYTYATNDNNHS